MATPLKLFRAFKRLKHPVSIRITETEGQIVDGRYQIVDLPEHTIRAVVLQIGIERLQFLPEGYASVGDINVITKKKDKLFFTDPKDETTQNRQSYVHHKGYKYRVAASGSTLGNATFRSYDCVRYMDLQ